MKYLTGTTEVSNWRISLSKVWLRVKIAIIVLAILEGVAVWNNPVVLLKQGKAFNRYWENRSRKITYNLIKETKGETIADIWDCKNTWTDFGKDIGKAWNDTISMFK